VPMLLCLSPFLGAEGMIVRADTAVHFNLLSISTVSNGIDAQDVRIAE